MMGSRALTCAHVRVLRYWVTGLKPSQMSQRVALQPSLSQEWAKLSTTFVAILVRLTGCARCAHVATHAAHVTEVGWAGSHTLCEHPTSKRRNRQYLTPSAIPRFPSPGYHRYGVLLLIRTAEIPHVYAVAIWAHGLSYIIAWHTLVHGGCSTTQDLRN